MIYHQIYDRADSLIDVHPTQDALLRVAFQCIACGTLIPDLAGMPDIRILRPPGPVAVSFLSPLLMGVVREDLLDAIGRRQAEGQLTLRKLLAVDGTVIEG